MRIGIVVRILWPAGTAKTAAIEAMYLQKMGHQVYVFFIRNSTYKYAYQDLLKNVNYVVLHPDHKSTMSGLYDIVTGIFAPDRKGDGRVDYDLIKSFYNDTIDYRLDYLICHDQWAGLAGQVAKQQLGIPYSVFLHERLSNFGSVPILGWYANYLERNVLSNASKIFVITNKIAESAAMKYPEYASKIEFNIHGMNFINNGWWSKS